MADTKITALTSISTSTDPANDVFPIVDISDNTITASGTTKKVTTNQLLGSGGIASFATLAVSNALTVSSGNISADNGRLNSSGASAAVRTSSLTADAFTTTVSTAVGVNNFFNTITITFTLNNSACTGIIDCQFMGFSQQWGDFLFGSNQLGVVSTMRSAASAGVTGVLTITGTGTIYTLVITCPTGVQFPSVNLRVSSGGGAGGGSLMSALPVVTFA